MNVTAYYLPEKIFHIKHPVTLGTGFWRLDYYLWEQRSTFFNEEEQKIVEHYVFRRNRSIEHLHPQDESHNEEWEEEAVHSFGNLAMISQSFNSQQSNDHIQIKVCPNP